MGHCMIRCARPYEYLDGSCNLNEHYLDSLDKEIMHIVIVHVLVRPTDLLGWVMYMLGSDDVEYNFRIIKL